MPLRSYKRWDSFFFWYLICKGVAWTKFPKIETTFYCGCWSSYIFSKYEFQWLCFHKGQAIRSFDDANTRQERWRTNRFAAFREIFDEFNKFCAKNMSPDDYIAIDQTYPIRGGISFKTYNKDKPAKYGLNFRSLGSSRRPYIYYTVPYTGKPVEVTESHIKDTLTLVNRIVEGHEQHGYSLKVTNISMDCYYTSIPLADGYLTKILLV